MILDQWLSYLREGLNTCYFCVAAMSFPEELHRKCIAHVRPHPSLKPEAAQGVDAEVDGEERKGDAGGGKKAAPGKTADERWEENLDHKLRSVLEEGVDVVEYGGRDVDE